MTTTVGLFHADFAQPRAGFRAGTLALATGEHLVPAVLPVLVGTRAAVAALTEAQPYPSLLQALLAVGWQDVNYLFENGAWYELTDMLGSRGERLAPPVAEPEGEPEPAVQYASGDQLKKIYQVTKSHHFDHDRDALRAAGNIATLEEASQLLDYIFREVKTRAEAEKGAGH